MLDAGGGAAGHGWSSGSSGDSSCVKLDCLDDSMTRLVSCSPQEPSEGAQANRGMVGGFRRVHVHWPRPDQACSSLRLAVPLLVIAGASSLQASTLWFSLSVESDILSAADQGHPVTDWRVVVAPPLAVVNQLPLSGSLLVWEQHEVRTWATRRRACVPPPSAARRRLDVCPLLLSAEPPPPAFSFPHAQRTKTLVDRQTVEIACGGYMPIHTADMRRAVSFTFYPEGYDWVESNPTIITEGFAGARQPGSRNHALRVCSSACRLHDIRLQNIAVLWIGGPARCLPLPPRPRGVEAASSREVPAGPGREHAPCERLHRPQHQLRGMAAQCKGALALLLLLHVPPLP